MHGSTHAHVLTLSPSVLVVGAKNSGKTSLISFLRHSLALPATKQATANSSSPNGPETSQPSTTYSASKSSFTSHYLETEMDGERVGLTLWDSAGLEKNIVDLQLREMAAFVESKFEETFVEEQKVMRSPGVKDSHIHCVFLVLDPVRLDANVQVSVRRLFLSIFLCDSGSAAAFSRGKSSQVMTTSS